MVSKTKIDEAVEKLSQRIAEGFYKPGERLPAAEDIAEELHVSRQTIRSALSRLELENKVEIKPKSGTYILEPLHTSTIGPSLKRKRGQREQLPPKEISYRYTFPSGVQPADSSIAAKMEIEEKTSLWRQHRVYFVNQIPYRIVDAYYPLSLLDKFPEHDDDPVGWLKKYVKQPGVQFPEAFESVSSRLPDEMEAEFLNLRKNQPVINVERWISIENDRVFAYIHVVANAALHEFTYTYSKANWEDLIDKLLVESSPPQFL